MNTYFETSVTSVTSPDEKAIMEERQHLQHLCEQFQKEIDKLNGELSHMKSDNEMLKDTIVRLSMKIVGVTN